MVCNFHFLFLYKFKILCVIVALSLFEYYFRGKHWIFHLKKHFKWDLTIVGELIQLKLIEDMVDVS